MKRIKKIYLLVFTVIIALTMVQCSEDDNNNIIEPEATCSDGIQNGDELGIDCGGSCNPCDTGGIDFSGTYIQEDQVGRPAISRVYITEALRDDFNTTIPSEMTAAFQADMLSNLMSLNPDFDGTETVPLGNALGQNAEQFTSLLSNDVLWVSKNSTTTFYNGERVFTGRALQDDAMDFHLQLLFGGPDINNPINDGTDDQPLLISDGVDSNDKAFLDTFPYLATPF